MRRQKPSVILIDDSDGDDAPQAHIVDLTDEPWSSVAAAAAGGHGSVIGGQSPTTHVDETMTVLIVNVDVYQQ